ncbi:MAG: YdcF family protein [Neisseriaceae bacterium]
MSLTFIHHLLQSFILPPLNAMTIIIIGLFYINRKRELGKTFITIGCIFLYFQSTPFFVYTLSGLIEKPQISQEELNKTQAIVVLGGGIRTNAYEYPEKFAPNSFTLIRLEYTAFLAHQAPDKLIIVSGGVASAKSHSEAEIMKNTLQNTFNITNPILVEEQSRNTNENAKYVAEMLKELKYNDIAIVSQAVHSTRAVALFKKYGIHAVAAPTDYMGHYTRNLNLGSFIPNAGTMSNCAALLHELLGYFVYITLDIDDSKYF